MRKIALIAVLFAACGRKQAVGYRTEAVTRGPVSEVVNATGDVSAIVTVNVGSQVSGIIDKLYVDFNSPVKKGQLLALSVPTWAPALQVNLGGDTSWRSSRERGSCNDTADQSALVGSRESAQFYCLYRTARLTYSATLVSTP